MEQMKNSWDKTQLVCEKKSRRDNKLFETMNVLVWMSVLLLLFFLRLHFSNHFCVCSFSYGMMGNIVWQPHNKWRYSKMDSKNIIYSVHAWIPNWNKLKITSNKQTQVQKKIMRSRKFPQKQLLHTKLMGKEICLWLLLTSIANSLKMELKTDYFSTHPWNDAIFSHFSSLSHSMSMRSRRNKDKKNLIFKVSRWFRSSVKMHNSKYTGVLFLYIPL